MSPPDSRKKDPRFRPYRIAAYALYLAVVGTFSILVIVSVVRSVWSQTPSEPEVHGESLPVARCLSKAESLWNELESERRGFSESKSGRALTVQFQSFRVDWLQRVRDAEARCSSDDPHRKHLARVFDALERLGDLYTTSATQYGGEIAPALARFRKAVADAR